MKAVPHALRYSRHRMVFESLFLPMFRTQPFIFPWGDQRKITKRRMQEQQKVLSCRRWKDNYTFAPVETVWATGGCQ